MIPGITKYQRKSQVPFIWDWDAFADWCVLILCMSIIMWIIL